MELIKVDAAEYNLKEKKAKQIAALYIPMINTLTELEEEFNIIVDEEVTEEVCIRAKRLRLDIGQVRINADKARKTAKDEYLRAGNAIQGAYNTLLFAVKSKEEKLLDVEKHFETMEAERLSQLQKARALLVSAYVEEGDMLPDLANMDEAVFENYVAGMKVAHEAKIQAEKEAQEAEAEAKRIEELNQTRAKLLTPYYAFMHDPDIFITLGELKNDEWDKLVTDLEAKKDAYDKEQERIKLENERLKKEAEAREKQAEIERKKREKEEEKRQKEEQLREAKRLDEKKKLEAESEAERLLYEKELQAERDRQQKIQAEKAADAQKRLDAERAERKKLQDELIAKKEAEEKAVLEERERIQVELSKGDAQKVDDLISDLEALKTKYSFKSNKYKSLYNQVGMLIDKVVNHIDK
jgi:hypothetical protein